MSNCAIDVPNCAARDCHQNDWNTCVVSETLNNFVLLFDRESPVVASVAD
jgi:hypothetical protein